MLLRRLILPIAIGALALAGCAPTDAADPAPSPMDPAASPTPSEPGEAPEEAAVDPAAWPPQLFTERTMPEADAVGQARADAWLDGMDLPPGAAWLETPPTDAPMLELQWQGWVCAPMGIATGYWRVPDMGVTEAHDWFAAHPGAGLMSPTTPLGDDGPYVHAATVAHLPEQGSLEGIAITVALAPGGVAVRAEVGAFGDTTVCPTPPPGVMLGGPGSG